MADKLRYDWDDDYERFVRETKAELETRPDKGNVLVNCISIIGIVAMSVLFAPFSFLLILLLAPLGIGYLALGRSPSMQQAGSSILIGCALGMVYLAVVASQW